uniref:Sulfhydryl oxidase n=1 Tax=Acrobeloides nanus TaxID=290746 RepID=A0A914E5V3_9BILA
MEAPVRAQQKAIKFYRCASFNSIPLRSIQGQLDVSNFDSTVYNSPKAYFIEFYSSWCGHCIHYKPTYVKFATLLKSWSNMVHVSVVNCADEKNSGVCRAHAIDAFPTIKYFKYMSTGKDDGKKYEGDKYDIDNMSLDLAKLLHEDYLTYKPAAWPKLEVTPSTTNLQQIWSSANSDAQYLAVVVEKEPYLHGYATMINFHIDQRVHVVVVDPSHLIAQQHGGVAVPGFHVFKKSSDGSPVYSSLSAIKWADVKTKIEELAGSSPEAAAPEAQIPKQEHVEIMKEPDVAANWQQYQVQYHDILSAISYMLTQEIPRKPIITGDNMVTLKDWIHVLRQFSPGTAPLKRLFYRLDEWLQKRELSMTAEEWIEKVDEINRQLGHPLLPKVDWVACKGSKPYLRGYTCGLWTLLHSLTVEAYRLNKDDSKFQPIPTLLEPMKQFIIKYLSCEICAQNFKRESATLNTGVKKIEDTVLWLWRTHNSVNKRLAGDASEDPKFPKRQFPPSFLCIECQTNGVYNEQRVLDFMLRYYMEIKMDGVEPQPGYKMMEFEKGKLQKVANKHLNPKFQGLAGKVDDLEEAEARLKQENIDASPKHRWRNLGDGDYGTLIKDQSADRRTFYFIWLSIIALVLCFVYFKYRQNKSRFWKTFYYYNDYKLFGRRNSAHTLTTRTSPRGHSNHPRP